MRYLILVIILFSCGANLSDGNNIRLKPPGNVVYAPNNTSYNRYLGIDFFSSPPVVDNGGSNLLQFELIKPIFEGISIDNKTGVLHVVHTVPDSLYIFSVQVQNDAGVNTSYDIYQLNVFTIHPDSI